MSSTPSEPTGQPPAAAPGKIRTWWHPLLASLLRWQLGSHYHLQEEVSVGQKPLQIDILLLQKEQGELPASARQILAGLVEYLGELTLLEFKSPSDTLHAGDFQTFLAYALLYRAQNQPLLETSKLQLVVLAPRVTKPYREELRVLGVTAQPQEPGVWSLQGGQVVPRTWVLETEVLAGLSHPLLTLFSPWLLHDRLRTYESLLQGGYTDMMVYVAQQIRQFQHQGKDFAMQHLGAEDQMQQVLHDFLASLPPEERLEGMSPEERLRGLAPDQMQQVLHDFLASLPPEERLEGMSPEERLRGLAPDQMQQVLHDFLASLPPEERLEGMSPKERLRGLAPDQMQQVLHDFLASLPPEERLEGMSPEERLRGLAPEVLLESLAPEELERLRQLLQTRTKADNPARPE